MAPALQISIPSTSTTTPSSTTSSAKPYTTYHITLALPLRTHTLTKRYSDFEALHAALLTQATAPPPAPLPAKSYWRRTVGNAAYTEQRRAGLEAYLRGIVDSDDGRWRASGAWRAFLDLPGSEVSKTGGAGAGAGAGAGRAGAAQVLDDPAQWLDAHREVKTAIHTARALLAKREKAATAQEQYARSSEAKAALVSAAAGIARCEEGLRVFSRGGSGGGTAGAAWGAGAGAVGARPTAGRTASAAGGLGEGEIRRRRDLLGASRKEVEGLESVLRSLAVKGTGAGSGGSGAGGAGLGAQAAATTSDRDALWKGTAVSQRPSGRVLGGAAAKETERTRELGNDGVLMLQKQVMREQEEDVLDLGKAVTRMKEMGIMINEELVVQNQMLGLLEQDVDRVEGKIGVAKKRIGKIS